MGNGMCMRWGAQRDPSPAAGKQVVRIHAQLTRRQSRDEQGSGVLPSGCSRSPCASQVGLVAQPGPPPPHPPPPAAASSKRLSGLLAGLSSIVPVFMECLLYTWPRAGLLGIPKKGMSSFALMAPVAFLGVVQSRAVGPVVLNTCSFCLLVSPCCLRGLEMTRRLEAPEETIWRLCGLRRISKSWCQRSLSWLTLCFHA